MPHSSGMGNLYQFPAPIAVTSRRMSGKTSQKQQEGVGFRSIRGIGTSAVNEGSSMCQYLKTMQDTGPQVPHGLNSYKTIMF